MKSKRVSKLFNNVNWSTEPVGEMCANGSGTRDAARGVLSENAFRAKVCEERKRTDRSKKPFLLMLVDVHRLLGTDVMRSAQEDILETLLLSKRETDACGWYEYGSTLGMIFTELDDKGINEAKKAIASKLRTRLSECMSADTMGKVCMYFHCYPEKHDKVPSTHHQFEQVFYPDIHPGTKLRQKGALAKRMIDIAGSSLGLLLCAPLLCIIALFIMATSRGPVLFRQERLGQFGRKFIFLKFRSMYVNADDSLHREYIKKLITENRPSAERDDDANTPVYKIRNDPRITPVGRFLRKTSLDELPQLFNTLKGEMSLVGPRPAIPYEVESYDIWHRYRLLQVKPGITGLWQVTGRSSTSFDEMVRLDLKYIQDWSLWLDIKILLRTPLVVIKGKGAY